MLRSFIAIFLLLALTSCEFSRLFIYAGFELNQNYISSTLCENKDKPELRCEGKCFLKKNLKQAEEKEKKQAQESQKKNFQEHYLIRTAVCLVPLTYFIRKVPFAEISFELPKNTFPLLQPPQDNFS